MYCIIEYVNGKGGVKKITIEKKLNIKVNLQDNNRFDR